MLLSGLQFFFFWGGGIGPLDPSIPPALEIQQRVAYAAAAVAQVRRYIKSNENKSTQKNWKVCSILFHLSYSSYILRRPQLFFHLELHK